MICNITGKSLACAIDKLQYLHQNPSSSKWLIQLTASNRIIFSPLSALIISKSLCIVSSLYLRWLRIRRLPSFIYSFIFLSYDIEKAKIKIQSFQITAYFDHFTHFFLCQFRFLYLPFVLPKSFDTFTVIIYFLRILWYILIILTNK